MKIALISSAHIESKNEILISGGDEETTRIGCFCFLIENDGKYALIDTGINSIETVNLTKKSKDFWRRDFGDQDIVSALDKLGVKPKDIGKVFITHSHYDHLSGITHFENAEFYMSEKEYEFLNESNPHKPFLKEEISFLKNCNLRLFDKDGFVSNGVFAYIVSGHTPGSTMYRIGDTLFTGDNIFLLESIKKKLPIGFCINREEAVRALDICLSHNGRIITSHDEECRKCLI